MGTTFMFIYEYDSVQYKMPFDTVVTENVFWRNVQGYPVNGVGFLDLYDDYFILPSPGRYLVSFDDTSVDAYYSDWVACDAANVPRTSGWHTCMATAQSNNPAKISISFPEDRDEGHPYTESTPYAVSNLTGNVNYNIVPGLWFKLSETPRGHHVFEVYVGGIWVESEDRYVPILNFPLTPQGSTSDDITITIRNNSGDSYALTAEIVNKATIEQSTPGTPFLTIDYEPGCSPRSFTDTTPLTISLDNYDATNETVDVLVDGEGVAIIDDSDTEYDDGSELSYTAGNYYMFQKGTPYEGIWFYLNDNLSDTDTATIVVRGGASVFEFKKSSDSTWTRGGHGTIDLGTIANGGTVDVDIRVSPLFNADTDLNPLEAMLIVNAPSVSLTYDHLPLSASVAEAQDDNMIIRASVYPNEDPEADAESTSTLDEDGVAYTATTLDVVDGTRFLTGGIIALSNGVQTDYFQITSISGNTLTVTSQDDDGLGNDGDQYTGYNSGATVTPVTGRGDLIGKYREFGIEFS